MVDLGVCIEAIRRAIVYGKGIIEYRRHPRKTDKSYARISTEGFVEAIRAIAENCPMDGWRKNYLLDRYRNLKESPWQTIAEYGLTEAEILNIPAESLIDVRTYLGYSDEKYEKYIPR